MKYLSLLSKFSFLFLFVFFVSSCTEDDIVLDTEPAVALSADAGYVWEDGTNLAGQTEFTVLVEGTAGTNEMETLTINEDGVKMDLARLSVAGNPVLLVDQDRSSFKIEVTIQLPATAGDYAYSFDVADVTGLIGSTSVTVSTASIEPISITLTTGSADVTTDAGNLVKIDVTATQGSALLSTLSVSEDGALIADLSRLRIGIVESEFTDNPLPLIEEEQDGFEQSIWIKAHTEEGVTKTYTVTLADEAGETADLVLNFTTTASGTPITSEINGVLLNAAGPAGTGGLDLDGGVGTGSNDTDAEIKDKGIDQMLPVDQNWRQKIAPTNNANLRLVDPSTVSEFGGFAGVSFVEQIKDAFDNSSTGAVTDDGIICQVSDVFAVERNGVHYLIECTAVNPTTVDNDDSYTFNIKW